jgi:hypothetical protein
MDHGQGGGQKIAGSDQGAGRREGMKGGNDQGRREIRKRARSAGSSGDDSPMMLRRSGDPCPLESRPVSLASVADACVRSRRLALVRDLLRLCKEEEEETLVPNLDARCRTCGTALSSSARCSRRGPRHARSSSAQACRAISGVIIRYGRHRGRRATEQERRSYGPIATACS